MRPEINSNFFINFIIYISLLSSCQTPGEQVERHDIIVYGATPAGIAASVMASRHGASVLLIEYSAHVGGMTTSGLATAEINHMIEKIISGFPREFYIRMGEAFYDSVYYSTYKQGQSLGFKPGDPAFFYESRHAEATFQQMLKESGVEISLLDTLQDLQKEEDEIQYLVFSSGRRVGADIFIDATYEGDLMAMAGVTYTFGREPISAYDENLAGIRFLDDTLYARTRDQQGNLLPYFNEGAGLREGAGDQRVMNFNYRPTMTTLDSNKLEIYPPKGYDPADFDFFADYLQSNPDVWFKELVGVYSRGNSKFEFNNRQHSLISLGMFNANQGYVDGDWETRNRIIRDHKYWTQGYLYFLTHDSRVPERLQQEARQYGYAKDEFTDNQHFPYFLYVREARRMQGEKIQTQQDIFETRSKEDAVFLGSHWVDSHHVQRVALSDTSFTNEGRIWEVVKQPYEISFSTLLPNKDECSNLLVPVAASFSHVAYCSFRVEPTWMQAGHTAGTAAAIALEQNFSLHDLPIASLQDQLRNEGMMIKLEDVGSYDDSRD